MLLNEDGNIHLIIGLFLSLFIASVLISWFLIQIYGSSGVTQLNYLDSANKIFNSSQNFVNNEIDEDILIPIDSDWDNQLGVGEVLINKRGFATGKLYVDKIIPSSGIVTNYYKINNSVHSDFAIILKRVPVDITGVNQELYFNNIGIALPIYALDTQWHDSIKVFYEDINKIDYLDIKTVYNIYKGSCQITVNGIVYNIEGIPIPSSGSILGFNEGSFGEYYGGVSSNTYGFALENFNTDNVIQNNITIYEQATGMLTIMAQVLLWNVDNRYLPWELNLLLIKSQLSALLLAIIAFIIGRD